MSNFEDYLNDYNLNNEEEDQLDPPQFRNSYFDNDSFGAASFEPEYSDDSADNDMDEYEDLYEDNRPMKGFKFPAKFGKSFSNGSNKAASEKRDPSGISKILVLLVAASLLISILGFFNVKSVQKSVEKMGNDLSSQISSLAAQTSELADRVSVIESGVQHTSQVLTTPGTSKYITITKQPTSVSSHIGRGNGEDGDKGLGLFFSIEAKGNGITFNSFVWQRQDPTGQWVNVGFDGANSKCDAYGLQNEVGKNADGTFFSKIYTYGLTSAGFGQYRCVVSDSTGESAISEIVEIRNDG